MSALSALNRQVNDDSDLSIDFDGDDTPPLPPPERTSEALARCMLDAALSPAHKRLLDAKPRLIVIHSPNEAASKLLGSYLANLDRSRVVETFGERQRNSGKLEPRGRQQLSMLEHGRSVVLISHDPEGSLVPEALAGADAIVAVSSPDLAVTRKTIRAVTGKIVRGLSQVDIDGLTIGDLITSIRPGLSAQECVANLRRAAAFHLHLGAVDDDSNVSLERLGLTKPVADWAYETLGIMRQVAEGSLKPKALRFACLEGPPGTGKTTVAQALATSAGWAFVTTSVGDWFANSGGNLGDVIRAARRFIDEMQLSKQPVVGLLDEIDALPDRAGMDADRASWWSPVVTYLLKEIDRLRKSGKPVLLIGATNHFEKLDKALVRPGRLEKRISVLMPDIEDRKRLFAGYLGDTIGGGEIATLARLSVTATPAQIESWCETALAKAKMEQRLLQLSDLIKLIAPMDGRSPEQDRAVAIHEAGHAIVAVEMGLPVTEVSILSIGMVGGWVNTRIDEHDLVTRDRVERIGAMILGGRAADQVVGDGAHGGAAGDIEAVNVLLRTAMLDLGLYGPIVTAANADLRNWQGNGASLWAAIKTELTRLHERAVKIVERRRSDIQALVDVLLIERVVTGECLQEILAPDKQAAVITHGDEDILPDELEQGRPA